MAKLYWKYGAMSSGKSIELLRTAHNYEEAGKNVLCFTCGDRSGTGKITSRIGTERDCILLSNEFDVFHLVYFKLIHENISCIFVDEIQFADEGKINELSDIVDYLKIPVMCYGLVSDFALEHFRGSERLNIVADEKMELKAMCSTSNCESKAIYNMRIDKNGNPVFDGNQVLVGGNLAYQSVCRKCYKNHQERGS
jgi:thymidine kinase